MPAILEYIPYRKRDFTRARDEPMHHYFAGHGYAAVRVDLRGSGDSDGFLLDEYLQQEHDDALEVIRWIAQQSWCSGAVGMMGKSWGGFNSLQVAALRPPELKAIITVCSTDDRYRRRRALYGRLPAERKPDLGLGADELTTPIRRIPSSSANAGAPCGVSVSNMQFFSPRCGSNIPGATITGSTAQCVKTTVPSPAPSMPSAAGPMPTATRFLGSWLGSRHRAKASSGLGPISIRTTGCPVRPSDSCKRRCAGGITG